MNLQSSKRPTRLGSVAQIFNLPYRRFPICIRSSQSGGPEHLNTRPTASRRYGRVQLCATNLL